MNSLLKQSALSFALLSALNLTGCDSDSGSLIETVTDTVTDGVTEVTDAVTEEVTDTVAAVVDDAVEDALDLLEEATETVVPVDPFNFESNALADTITSETCTLTNGEQTQCYRITIAGVPSNYDIGDFCPTDINSTADEGGIWFDGGGEVYNITGEFIKNLATLYNDDNWLLYDPDTGLVNVTDSYDACNGAAQPDVEAQYQNHCVVCDIDYVDGGITAQYLIPVTPVAADDFIDLGNSEPGVSLNGVTLAAPAPVEAILANYTIAAFDDCAGHINLAAGYHYHGAGGCNEIISQDDDDSAMFAYALDGYGIFGMVNTDGEEPTDLDECRGHVDESRGYHYHAASVAENMFIGCFRGEIAR